MLHNLPYQLVDAKLNNKTCYNSGFIRNDFDLDETEINDDYKFAIQMIESFNRNLFITGKAGTGKSTLLKFIKECTDKNFAVVAPTGLAALNVTGQTIHSFFKFPLNVLTENSITKFRDTEMIKALQLLIIDEVSMVRADIMDAIDESLRKNRGINKPFGGVQVVLFGDLCQLPPVVKGRDMEEYFNAEFGGPYFFNAKVFDKMQLDIIELKQVYRQKDEGFIKKLNRVREKRIDKNLIAELNEEFFGKTIPYNDSVMLTTTNFDANQVNDAQLERLLGTERIYNAEIVGNFPDDSFPTEMDLRLKLGAQVMLIKNDPLKRWVNGSLAIISHIGEDYITVKLNSKNYRVEGQSWENIAFKYNPETGKIEEKVVGIFSQLPVKLAWAVTIHKSQGQTFDKVIIDFGAGAFAHGQAYVALSRCTKASGVVFTRPLKSSDFILDDRIYDVYEKFNLIN